MIPPGRNITVGIALVALTIGVFIASNARAQAGFNANQLVELAIESSPQINSMHAQWQAAEHQISQNYAPADPIFNFANIDASHGLMGNPASHSLQLNENFQFPGKALLQADEAKRIAQIARFGYEAAIRYLRSAVKTTY